MSREKIAIMGYRTLFEGSDIHYSNSGLQITPAKYINGYFMRLWSDAWPCSFRGTHIRSCTRRHSSWTEIWESAPRPTRMPTVFGVWQFCFDSMRQVSTDFLWTPYRPFVLSKTLHHFEAYTRPICYLRLYNQAQLLLMPILTLGKVHIGLQYILISHCPRHSILIRMGARHLTRIFLHT